MISWGIKNYPIVIGDYNSPRTGNPELNQPGFNGMTEGFVSHCSCVSSGDVHGDFIFWFFVAIVCWCCDDVGDIYGNLYRDM